MLKAKLAKLPDLPSLNPDGSTDTTDSGAGTGQQGGGEEEEDDGLGELG